MRRTAVLGLSLALLGCVAAPQPVLPPHRSAVFRAGEAALLVDDFEAAERAFTQALEEAGADVERAAEAGYWVGVCRRKQENLDGARAAWTRSLAAGDPRIAAVSRVGIGRLAWDAHDWNAAREMFTAVEGSHAPMTREERDEVRRLAAFAAIRSGNWNAGLHLYPPPEDDAINRARDHAVVRHILAGGQFACVLGPYSALDAERQLQELTDARRPAEAWEHAGLAWVILRPFTSWDAADAEAQRWRAKKVSVAALP